MNLRQLKKQDKRVAAILLALGRCAVSPKGFGLNDEWDEQPALDYLNDIEGLAYMADCIDPKTGGYLPDDQCPPYPSSAMRKLPAGWRWRWRGGRLVPVDKHGAMVRATQAAKGGGDAA